MPQHLVSNSLQNLLNEALMLKLFFGVNTCFWVLGNGARSEMMSQSFPSLMSQKTHFCASPISPTIQPTDFNPVFNSASHKLM